jgi:hypothetical protein
VAEDGDGGVTLAFPKPEKPARGTTECARYMADVARLPCVVCRRFVVQVHHPISGRYSQRRAPDTDTIPLCWEHHEELHRHPARWRAQFGADTDYIERTRRAVEQLRANTIGGR